MSRDVLYILFSRLVIYTCCFTSQDRVYTFCFHDSLHIHFVSTPPGPCRAMFYTFCFHDSVIYILFHLRTVSRDGRVEVWDLHKSTLDPYATTFFKKKIEVFIHIFFWKKRITGTLRTRATANPCRACSLVATRPFCWRAPPTGRCTFFSRQCYLSPFLHLF